MGKPRVVGLTFDLREEQVADADAPPDFYGEFDTVENINHLERAIAAGGYEVVRIGNLARLAEFLVKGGRVDLVFNMAEGMWGRSREGHVPSLLEAYRIPYTGSDPLSASLGLDKSMAKRLWQAEGLPTAPFALINRLEECDRAEDVLPAYPFFVKPAYEGTSKGIGEESVVYSAQTLRERVRYLLATYRQPVLVETLLPGTEYTVGILGGGDRARPVGVVQVKAVSASGVNGFLDKEHWDRYISDHFIPVGPSPFADQLSDLALSGYRALGCQDVGRVDLRCDAAGQPQLLEVNPIPGFHPTHAAITTIGRFAGMSYEALVHEVIDHASRRWGLIN
jgi:D-alanine-D-alanine ligase